MITTLQKEYALIYYIHTVLGQSLNNGFLHELYTEKNIKTILEALINNKIKDQQTINVERVIDRVSTLIDIDTLTNPSNERAKFNVLPYSPVSFMELYMGKNINNVLVDMMERVFVDDITDAKDGLAGHFVSMFTVKNMANPAFYRLVTLNKRPDISEIEDALHTRYPNSSMFANTKDMSDIETILEPYAKRMSNANFTQKDMNGLFTYIAKNFRNSLSPLSLENGIDFVIKKKDESTETSSAFDDIRDETEENIKTRVQSAPSIYEFFKEASKARFAGTMKYTKNGTLDGTDGPAKAIEMSLMRQDTAVNDESDRYELFISVLDNLLKVESLPPVNRGMYRDKRKVILTEEQYHALFPEYFVTVGIIKEKVSSTSELGGAKMKSGDEGSSVIDNYTGEQQYEEDDDDSDTTTELSVGKSKKLMLAKMLATINGHPSDVPDKLTPTTGVKSMIYELNRILLNELFNTSYTNLEGLVDFLTTGDIKQEYPAIKDNAKSLSELKDRFLYERDYDRRMSSERDTHVKAFAIILSELSRMAKMDPQSVLNQKNADKYNRTYTSAQYKNIIITKYGKTYILNTLPGIVELMAAHAKAGEYISSMTLTGSDPVKSALDFLTNTGLLTEDNNVCRLETDTETTRNIINGMDWDKVPDNNSMLSDALRNCSYIYRINGWVRMSDEELAANKFTPIEDKRKEKSASYDIGKLVSVIEHLQGKIRPYVFKLKDINYIIDLIKKQYHIDTLSDVVPPDVSKEGLQQADIHMQSYATDNSAEAFDNFSQMYYLNYIREQYEEIAENARKAIRQTLAENHLLTADVQNTLIQKVNRGGNSGRKTAIINEIFDGVKRSYQGNAAENINKIELSNIVVLSESIIVLYNKALNLCSNDTAITDVFSPIEHVTVNDMDTMAKGSSPSGKTYTENGDGCQPQFMLNAYLINILFEAIYMLRVHYGLQDPEEYTARDVDSLTNINEMEDYIKATIGSLAIKDNPKCRELLTKINRRLNILFNNTNMLNLVIALRRNNPGLTRLTTGAASHMSIERLMNNITSQQENDFDLKAKQRREALLDKYLPMD